MNSSFLQKYKSGEKLTIVCIGDSTTSQEWCHPNWVDWINFIFRQSDDSVGRNRRIFNSSVDGGDLDIYLQNFEVEIASFKPDLVIISLGFNHLEMLPRFSEKTVELIRRIKQIGAEVLLWSTYETVNLKYSKQLSTVNDIYKKISETEKCFYSDMYHEFQKYDLNKIFTYIHKWDNTLWGLKPGDIDFLHCNEVGNQIIAEKILKDFFNTDLSLCEEFKGMGNMNRVDLDKFKI